MSWFKKLSAAALMLLAVPVAADTPSDYYDPILNGRNFLAGNVAAGRVNCLILEQAWEASFNYVSDWLENHTGIPQPRLSELSGTGAEDQMNAILNEANNLDVGLAARNIRTAKTALHLWTAAGCWKGL